MVMRRSSPLPPASSSRSSARDSATSRRTVATVTPRGSGVPPLATGRPAAAGEQFQIERARLRDIAKDGREGDAPWLGRPTHGGDPILVGLDQSEVAVFAPVQDVDGI